MLIKQRQTCTQKKKEEADLKDESRPALSLSWLEEKQN